MRFTVGIQNRVFGIISKNAFFPLGLQLFKKPIQIYLFGQILSDSYRFLETVTNSFYGDFFQDRQYWEHETYAL